MADQPCQNCGREPQKKPSIFRNDPWCSDLCRKALENNGILTREEAARKAEALLQKHAIEEVGLSEYYGRWNVPDRCSSSYRNRRCEKRAGHDGHHVESNTAWSPLLDSPQA